MDNDKIADKVPGFSSGLVFPLDLEIYLPELKARTLSPGRIQSKFGSLGRSRHCPLTPLALHRIAYQKLTLRDNSFTYISFFRNSLISESDNND